MLQFDEWTRIAWNQAAPSLLGLLGSGLRRKAVFTNRQLDRQQIHLWVQQLNWRHFQWQPNSCFFVPSFMKKPSKPSKYHRFFFPNTFSIQSLLFFRTFFNGEADSWRGCKHDPGSPQWSVWMRVPEAGRWPTSNSVGSLVIPPFPWTGSLNVRDAVWCSFTLSL